jgi:peptidoglycan/LPS O-acetylase OafA/YrhL
MQRPPPLIVTRRLRGRYALAAVVLLALWAASLVSLFDAVDWQHIAAAIFATVTALPLGLIALLGAISGNEAAMERARVALFAAGALLMLIVAAEVARRVIFVAGNHAG